MNNINRSGLRECCGCGCCAVVCPTGAIVLDLDVDGYIVAKAMATCEDCAECLRICPKFLDFDTERFPRAQALYVGTNKDIGVRYPSSSGGIATALAVTALRRGYVVVSACLNLELGELRHIIIDNEGDLELIRGSKYIPSHTQQAFAKLVDYEKALVIGTPCQIYALRKLYPAKDIVYVDFRCSGTVGYNLFRKYTDHLRRLNPSGIKKINFRAKNRSWHIWGVEAEFRDGGRYFKDKRHDLFGKCYSVYYDSVHDVCHQCGFLNETFADIRIEDAWHQMRHIKHHDYKNGLSQIAVFSDKGGKLFSMSCHILNFKQVKNDFHTHTSQASCSKASTLYYMIRNDDISLEETVKNFERKLPFSKRLALQCSYLVSINLYVYRAARAAYKMLVRLCRVYTVRHGPPNCVNDIISKEKDRRKKE